jgi:hypothetical protein
MIAPGRWRDDGPQQAVAHAKPYSSIHADNVGQMKPTVTAGGLSIAWKGERKAHSITGKPKP